MCRIVARWRAAKVVKNEFPIPDHSLVEEKMTPSGNPTLVLPPSTISLFHLPSAAAKGNKQLRQIAGNGHKSGRRQFQSGESQTNIANCAWTKLEPSSIDLSALLLSQSAVGQNLHLVLRLPLLAWMMRGAKCCARGVSQFSDFHPGHNASSGAERY